MARKPTIYRIHDWDDFENAASRKLKNLSWVRIPNTPDLVNEMRDFGLLVLLVQMASRNPAPREGWLTKTGGVDGKPYTLDDFSVIFRTDLTAMERGVKALTVARTRGTAVIIDLGLKKLDRVVPRQPSGWARIRGRILHRDKNACAYCGRLANSVDHVVPRALGGSHDDYNLVACCKSCNSKKGARTPQEAGMG